jgi:UDP-N-acetylglucosamine 2-epimerase (non-hydrolysing)
VTAHRDAAAQRPVVLVVAGTRPEAIKMAPVYRALRARPEVEAQLVLTGQHRELVDEVLARFRIEAQHNLQVMRPGQDLYDLAAGCLAGLRDIVQQTGARGMLVQGDTASVFFGALVGFFERIWVGHVEAGLRSGDPDAPWPEENLRRMTDVLSGCCFAPTPWAARNLEREHLPRTPVHVTGNPVVDALQQAVVLDAGSLPAAVPPTARERPLVLLTAHRRESFGEPLRRVLRTVRELADRHPEVDWIYPVHPNPQVHGPAHALLSNHPRIHLLEPLSYFDLVAVLARARLVLTDSGGIQEEAPTFGVPVVVLRDVTERPEGVDAGVAELVGTDPGRIEAAVERHLAEANPPRAPVDPASQRPSPYGDGRAGERIADLTAHYLTGSPRRTKDWPG